MRLIVRAQASHFVGETPDQLFGRARSLAAPCQARGYSEVEATVVAIRDPGGGPSTLDTWYEVAYEKVVTDEELVEELRYALGVEKAASTG